MQLGTRWSVGGKAPDELPAVVLQAIETVESDVREVGADTTTWRWTLTWLEKKPVVELDDGTVIRYEPGDDSATIIGPLQTVADPFDDDE